MDLNTIAEVVQPRQRDGIPPWSAGDALLAGGTWLFSEPQHHLKRLIDLGALGWAPIEADGEGLHIAATCTVAKLNEFSMPAAWTAAPLIGQCCRAFLASFKIWNTATVGGNICMSLPAGPMISLTAALDGVATIWGGGGSESRVPVMEFITGAKTNVLRPGEILRQIDIPAAALVKRTAFRQLSLTPLGRSAALLIGTLSPDSGAFDLTITASTMCPVRLSFPKLPDVAALKQRIAREVPDDLYCDDVHGDPRWRKQVTPLLAEDVRNELAGGPAS
jgi:CO/xanthine dehydrogenase FAD-binding subunit